jgi:1,2-phenylacetyl-CoA epoxidase catalytic subunit
MAQTRIVRTRAEMDQEYFDILVHMIRSQGYRELAAATVFAEALFLVPTIRFKKKVVQHIEEEMEHFEACCVLYAEIGAGDLDAICTKILGERAPIPRIESFLELGVAQLLYDRASAFQLREYENSSFDPYCRVVGKILEEEEGHESFGAEILIDRCRDAQVRDEAQRCFDKWLAVSLRSFGRPGSARSRRAITAGLKTRDSAAVAQEYIDSLKSVTRMIGLDFPTRERLRELGTETAADVDLSR